MGERGGKKSEKEEAILNQANNGGKEEQEKKKKNVEIAPLLLSKAYTGRGSLHACRHSWSTRFGGNGKPKERERNRASPKRE